MTTQSHSAKALDSSEDKSSTGARVLHALERWVLLWLLLIVAAFFALHPTTGPIFTSTANLSILTGNQAVIVLVALGVLVPLVAGHFDFSVGANHALCAIIAASLMAEHGLSLWASVILAILLGALIGAINGVLVAVFKLNSFVITLGVSTLLAGIIAWYTDGQTIATGIDPGITDFGSEKLFGLPRIVYAVALVVVVMWYLLTQTPFGRRLYAIGANPRSSRLVGIRVDRVVLTSFILSGTLAGLAGVAALARAGSATPDTGTSALFPAIAAVFLGATAVTPGRFNVIGTIIGVSFVAVVVSGLVLMGADNWVDPVFNGLSLVLAVGLSTFFRRQRTGSADID